MSPLQVGIRFTDEDLSLLEALAAKLGLNRTAVVRLAIRKLAEAEGVTLQSKRSKR
jgi:biotin operon repressor